MTKLNKTIKYISSLAIVLSSPLFVFAAGTDQINLNEVQPQWQGLSNITINAILVFAINGVLIASGIVAFFFLLWGGMQWILAGGDKEGTDKARKRITAALIGLAIVFSAYALAILVKSVFGVDILKFTIPKIV